MTFGVRVSFTEKDKATLGTLAARAPHLVDAAWEERAGAGFVGIFSNALDGDTALDLKLRGLDVIRHVAHAGTTPAREAIPVVSGDATVRHARGLLEAVRPVAVRDSVPAEALFFARVDGGAQRTLERLLLLERDDATVGEVPASDLVGGALAGTHWVVVRVPTPPLYLLYRAREEIGEGVRVFVRSTGQARVFTTWGTVHPLAELLEDRLTKANRSALVDADGHITLTTAAWTLRPILDAVRPDLVARRDVLEPISGSLSFPVRMRLGPADVTDPELWILTPEQLFSLEAFVDASAAEEVGRLLVSRLATADGRAMYVLREAVRPQLTRLGPRIASIVGEPGFARAAALDNLYVPPARRLVPQLGRDQLKALLGLETAAAVIVDEDSDGLKITSVATLEDAPMSRFTTWAATDRRHELDRLMEDAVLAFPGVHIDRPEKVEKPATDADHKAPSAPRTPKERTGIVVTAQSKEAPVEAAGAGAQELAALRVQARALEERVLGAGASDGAAWRSLGILKTELQEVDDAASCHEVAVFLGAQQSAGELAQAVHAWVDTDEKEPSLMDLALGEPASLTREGATSLGARIIDAFARGERVDEEIIQHTQKIFMRDDILVGRRLQWAVLHAICARSKDALGATRAKEVVLGALNARGLSETLDLPRFVRTSLALLPGDDGGFSTDRSRHEQLVQLEKIFTRAVPQPLKFTDSRDAFLRAIFAVGLGRLGGKAPEIIRSVQNELDAHVEPPIKALLRLYIARLSHFLTKGTMELWKKEVDAVVSSLSRPEDKRVVEWLVKRSMWLRAAPPAETPMGLRPALERHVQAAEKSIDDLPSATTKAHEMKGLYDYEVSAAIERMLKAALGSGRDDIIRGTLLASLRGIQQLKIVAHRVRALGACVGAAATLDDGELVDQCLDGISAAARSPTGPSVRDLLVAVKPGLAALRRLGAVDAASRFLSSLEPFASSSDKETGPLLAALSDGFLQLGDGDKAKALVAECLRRAMLTSSKVDRFEAGIAILEALTHWDLEARTAQCLEVVDALRKFDDTFTTNRFFETHQLLIAERVVETIVDDATLRSDRLQAYLDGEEQVVRRRILQQWSILCGR